MSNPKRRTLGVLVFCAALAPLTGGAVEPDRSALKAPTVFLTLSSREFEVGDPVLVRVTLINGTRRPLPLYTKFSAQTGLVQFRMQVEGEWQVIKAYGQGRASPRNAQSELRSGDSRSTNELLFFVGETPVFAEPGEFNVRAVVRCPPGEYLSAPVAISVKPSSPEKLAFLTRDKLGMLSEQLLGGPSTLAFEFPLTDVQALPESLLRRQLLTDHVFYRWGGDAKGGMDGAEWRELSALLPKLDEVNRDRFHINMAHVHFKNRRYEEALQSLNALPDPTPSAIWLRGELESAKRGAPPTP